MPHLRPLPLLLLAFLLDLAVARSVHHHGSILSTSVDGALFPSVRMRTSHPEWTGNRSTATLSRRVASSLAVYNTERPAEKLRGFPSSVGTTTSRMLASGTLVHTSQCECLRGTAYRITWQMTRPERGGPLVNRCPIHALVRARGVGPGIRRWSEVQRCHSQGSNWSGHTLRFLNLLSTIAMSTGENKALASMRFASVFPPSLPPFPAGPFLYDLMSLWAEQTDLSSWDQASSCDTMAGLTCDAYGMIVAM